MNSKVANDDLVDQVARLTADMDALDRGVIDAGLVASRALAWAETLEAVLRAAGIDDPEAESAETFADVVAAEIEARRRKAEARRRRIAASGLTFIRGGGAS